ncbi:MAG: crossover junction endodeoxyribonuclease RuvC [Thermoleophilia bacterium]|nr:crossover junction endodeoxyribonuclease RuvC [Thermoleophilia bacterium]
MFGIDPGTASTGFAIIDQDGPRLTPVWYDCLKTTPAEAPAARLVRIAQAARDVVRQFAPHEMAIEELFFGVNAKAALAVGQARGVLMLACAEAGLEVFEYSPSSIKQAVTGYGRADKTQMQHMVMVTLGMSEIPKPDHAADALAAAICHAGSFSHPQVTSHGAHLRRR